MSQKTYLLIALGLIFIIGAGIIIYQGRPVMKLNENNIEKVDNNQNQESANEIEIEVESEYESEEEEESQSPVITVETESVLTTNASTNSFTMAEVAKHNTEADCWSAINGSVYDLSTWVSRHPGGSKAIIKLCGTDGSASFTKKHGGATKPQAALVLLKIGSLK